MTLATFLMGHGYALAFRRDGFVEVLATRGDERFLGRGGSDDEAVSDLVRVMFPSALSRTLLEAELSTVAAREMVAVEQPPAASPDEPDATTEEPAPPPVEAIEAPAQVEPALGIAAPTEPTAVVAEVRAAVPVRAVPTGPSAEDVREAVDACADILAEIDERLDELSRIAPEGQRLLMLSFICRARAEVEEVPHVEVHQATSRVAKRLSDLAKVLWPGSVRALQLGVMPSAALPGGRGFSPPRTWDDAAASVELLIADRRAADRRERLDDDGYADAASLAPSPENPAALASEAARSIEVLKRAMDVALAVRTAAQVRWVRGRIPGRQWGAMMGALRQMTTQLGSEGDTLRNYLDPSFAPRRSWRVVVEGEPRLPEKPAVNVDELRMALPAVDAPNVDELLGAWLPAAVLAFDTASMVEMLRPHGATLARMSGEVSFSDRRARRRFRDVLLALSLVEANDDASIEGDVVEEEDTEEHDVAGAAFDALVDEVRSKTAGRSAMFVSNREDPDLARKLEELLALRLSWVESTPRRIEAACEKIARTAPDFVLSATGFQLHSVDASLAKAARRAGVPFVRVNRGRPVACVLAIARELGIGRGASRAAG